MKIGQTVYLKPIGNNSRYSQELIKVEIDKIGRKYFEVNIKHYGRFFIETMIQDCGDYISGYKCYLSLQEIKDEEEHELLFSEIKKEFSAYRTNLPLSKLKEISQIIKKSENNDL